jgi:multidrug resistance efflux pump
MSTAQGTVAAWSAATGARVLLDDGTVLDVPAAGLVGARLLRPGQRVRVGLADDDATPVTVTLLTLPLP